MPSRIQRVKNVTYCIKVVVKQLWHTKYNIKSYRLQDSQIVKNVTYCIKVVVKQLWHTKYNIKSYRLQDSHHLHVLPWKILIAALNLGWYIQCIGSGCVILAHLRIGLAPQKHDLISMPSQQNTNTKHIQIESYHPVVSIMLRYIWTKKKYLVKICVATEWKSTKSWGGGVTYHTFLSNATTFCNDCNNKRSVRIKHIS